MFLFGATRGGGVFAGTIRMKKETCIYLILPKGEEFWDSWILYFFGRSNITNNTAKTQYFKKANKFNNLGNI